MPFSVNCPVCQKVFKTGTSLSKHVTLKHPQSTPGKLRFIDHAGIPCEEPKSSELDNERKDGYLEWLTVLVERINACLVPDHPGNYSYSVKLT